MPSDHRSRPGYPRPAEARRDGVGPCPGNPALSAGQVDSRSAGPRRAGQPRRGFRSGPSASASFVEVDVVGPRDRLGSGFCGGKRPPAVEDVVAETRTCIPSGSPGRAGIAPNTVFRRPHDELERRAGRQHVLERVLQHRVAGAGGRGGWPRGLPAVRTRCRRRRAGWRRPAARPSAAFIATTRAPGRPSAAPARRAGRRRARAGRPPAARPGRCRAGRWRRAPAGVCSGRRDRPAGRVDVEALGPVDGRASSPS